MLRVVAAIKYKKILKKLKEYHEVDPDNWLEVKQLVIEGLRYGTKADMGCKDSILSWNMLVELRRSEWAKRMIPAEYYTDLFCTLRDMTRKDNPELWAMIDRRSDLS